MQYLYTTADHSKTTIAVLCKRASFNNRALHLNYITPLVNKNIPLENILAVTLSYQTLKKCTADHAKTYLADLLPELKAQGITTLFVNDTIYFKILTGIIKTANAYGYIYPCKIKNYTDFNVIFGVNYQAIIYNPALQIKLDLAITTVGMIHNNNYTPPGKNIIHTAQYLSTTTDIAHTLNFLHDCSILYCDVETKGLEFYNCGLSTIAFSWDKHNGVAFPVDRHENSPVIKLLLRKFFINYPGKLIFHNATFDIKVLIYQLWMRNLADYIGLIDGLIIFKNKIDDTKLIAYLALNNTIETKLGLKHLAFDFAGDYGQEDIANTELIPLPELLEYNLKDCLCTCYVHEKYYPIMIQDQQENIYTNLFKPAIITILQMELSGMPLDINKVKQLKQKLLTAIQMHKDFFQNCHLIQDFHLNQLELKAEAATINAKKKIYTIYDSVIAFDFNPNSDVQLQKLIYLYLDYTPFDFTKSKAPATGTKTLTKLINHATCPEHKEIFQHLIDHALADKILTSFIPAFENAQQLPDGSYRLYGNFNLGGTKSGRLSSSNPNLTNIPSHSTYGKAVKECFISPPGWIFAGSDFDSLEDKVNALITQDPNKLKVYTDGYDGHSLRAFSYFKNDLPNITNTIKSINSIADLHPDLRQMSKAPTFALTYAGTYITLMNNCGFDKKTAKRIEANYHDLYQISDHWIECQLQEAIKRGYVTCAFGLRLRTPILKQTLSHTSYIPFIAQKERRSAGNAIGGQSYGLLTTRAGIAFQERCLASEYKYDIMQVAHIHDAIYVLFKDDAKIAKWVNDNLIECMAWQNLPELQHKTIKLSSTMEIYWPAWDNAIAIPNHSSKNEIKIITNKAKE